jgi:carbon starvation protein CstA
MNSLLIAVASIVLYLLAYHTSVGFVAHKFFKIDPKQTAQS